MLRPRMGPGESVWRYKVTVPLEEVQPRKRQRATADDLLNLQQMFVQHFGGFTRLPNSRAMACATRTTRSNTRR